MLYAYLACLFPIQVWSIYNLLKEVPAWVLQMNAWELLGTIAYTQMFVLFESIVIFLPFVVLSALLPASWLRARFVALTTAIVYLSAGWSILAHTYNVTFITRGAGILLPWIGLFIISQVFFHILFRSNRKIEAAILWFVNRIAILAAVYLLVDLLAVLIVILRNV